MKFRFALTALAAVVLSVAPLSAEPCAGSAPKGEHHGRGMKGLECKGMMACIGLNDQQKEKLKALHEEMKGSRDAQMEKMKALRDKIKVEFTNDAPNQLMLNQFAEESAQLHKEMTKARFEHFLKIKSTLTKEQFQKILECQGPGMEGCQGLGDKGMCKQGGKHGECASMKKGCHMDKKGCPMKAGETSK